MRSFLQELKRRHIVKAVVAYVLVAGLFTQIGVTTFPVIRFPAWTADALIILLVLAFPVAMSIACSAAARVGNAAVAGPA